MNKINRGEGTFGKLIQDPTLAENLNQTLINIRKTTDGLTGSDTLMAKLNTTVANAQLISQQVTEMMHKINTGNGTLGRLIRDTTLAENLNQTLINLKTSTKGLDENMTAAKHSFLFKGYFDRKAKAANEKKIKAKEAAENINK
jgi:phospholipid/cholesterol/gamma-HCH transport system substrate-binding protein